MIQITYIHHQVYRGYTASNSITTIHQILITAWRVIVETARKHDVIPTTEVDVVMAVQVEILWTEYFFNKNK